MASPLKRVNLMLDEGLVERLRREARGHHVSMSEMARALLDRELGRSREPEALTFAIRHEVAVYDAVFVVLARQLGGDLVTADGVLWDKVAGDCPWVKRL